MQAALLWDAVPCEGLGMAALCTVVLGVTMGVAMYSGFFPGLIPRLHQDVQDKTGSSVLFTYSGGFQWALFEEGIRLLAVLSQLPMWPTSKSSGDDDGGLKWLKGKCVLSQYDAGLFHSGMVVMAVDVTRSWIHFTRHEAVTLLPGYTLGPLLCAPWCRHLVKLVHGDNFEERWASLPPEAYRAVKGLLAGLGVSVTCRWFLVSLWAAASTSASLEMTCLALEAFVAYAFLASAFSVPEPTGWRKWLQKSLVTWFTKQVLDRFIKPLLWQKIGQITTAVWSVLGFIAVVALVKISAQAGFALLAAH